MTNSGFPPHGHVLQFCDMKEVFSLLILKVHSESFLPGLCESKFSELVFRYISFTLLKPIALTPTAILSLRYCLPQDKSGTLLLQNST